MSNANPFAAIKAIEYKLPSQTVTNEDLARQFPEWTAQRIEDKLGIAVRHIAAADECASDLGVCAAERLFASGACRREEIDYLLFCTQSPDYFLPTTACTMQTRLGLSKCIGALDFNLGCSGFVYGLGLAKGLIETNQARNVLLVTAETYSKYMHPDDKNVRTLFGDAGAATLVSAVDAAPPRERPGLGHSATAPTVQEPCNWWSKRVLAARDIPAVKPTTMPTAIRGAMPRCSWMGLKS